MSAVIAENVLRSAAGRWRQIDRLLPDPEPPADGICGTELMVRAANGRAAAVGWCRHHQVEPEGAELTWRAAAQFWLTAHVAGDPAEPGIGTALDELLVRWRAHLAEEPATSGEDSQAGLRWPCRDVAGVRALLRHSLQPLVGAGRRSACGRATRPGRLDSPGRQPAPGGLSGHDVGATRRARVRGGHRAARQAASRTGRSRGGGHAVASRRAESVVRPFLEPDGLSAAMG